MMVEPAPFGRARTAVTIGILTLSLAQCAGPSFSLADADVSREAGAPSALGSASEVDVTLRCDQASYPISPLIYGIGVRPGQPEAGAWALGASARRWGGNHTSRYNWELGNAWNTGKDWYFKNVDYDHLPRPAHVRFIEESQAHGMVTFMTLPTLGWVAKDTSSFGFPVHSFGAQRASEPHHPDVGDGVSPRGALLAPRPPTATSVPMPPASIGRWVRANRERDQDGPRSVAAYILDNEPMLWHETHRDVHPAPVSYDELLARSIAYAREVRAADPEALIAGPALWGWTSYFFSAVDTAAYPRHPDRDAHGGVALLPWWLGQMAAEEARTGTRLLDLVDVHFYPQGPGIGIGTEGATDADTAARRIRSTRSLWDPSYQDESWIAEKMALVPRLRAWIREQHPGLGISIGEYNFGAERHASGGLAVAEALGRFGELGIAAAFYWDYPEVGSAAFWAFRAYRDFDGRGGRFLDDGVSVESGAGMLSIFASRDSRDSHAGHVVVVLLNRDPTVAQSVRVDTSSCGSVSDMRTFVYGAGAPGLVNANRPAPAPGAPIEAALPPYSITVLDLHFSPIARK